MLLFTSIVLGIIIGTIRKGSIFRLDSLRWLWLAILPLASVFLMKAYPSIPLLPKAVATTFSYLCVMLFIIANRKYKLPCALLGLGTLSNYLVIAINSFRMPISVTALSVYPSMTAEAVISQRADYFVAVNGAKLMFLGDTMYVPIKIFDGFMSIGDILLSIGMFLLIVQVMGKNSIGRKKTTEDVT